MPLINLSLDTDAILEIDPARAYAIASLAAAQNDVPAVEAFLRSGLNPASTEHKNVQRRTRATIIHCPWLAAVRNDASDVVDAIIRFKPKMAPKSKLMGAKPYGLNAVQTAIDDGSVKTLAVFQAHGMPVKPLEINTGGASRPGEGAPLYWAAVEGLEDAARWLLSSLDGESPAAPRNGAPGLAHYLAAGNCAQLLAEQKFDAEAIHSARSTELPSRRAARLDSIANQGLVFANQRQQLVGYDPVDWALWAQARDALAVLTQIVGPKKVAERAEWWISIGRPLLADLSSLRFYGVDLSHPSHPAQVCEKVLAHCESVAIGSVLPPPAAASAPAARPRGLRL